MKYRRTTLAALCAVVVVAVFLVSPLMPGLWTVVGALLLLGVGAAMVVIGRKPGAGA